MPRRIVIWTAVFAALIATRWTLAPKYLFYIDNINFALAIEHFQPLLHQPHPPGDPLFVLVLKTLHLFISNVKYVELLAGTLGSLVTLILIYQLGNAVFEPPAGALAVAIMFFLPAFWLAGIGNHVRIFTGAGSAAVALCVWRVMQNPHRVRWLLVSAAALGIAAGFRPELLLLLFPLLCLAWYHGTRTIATAFAAFGTLGIVTSLWAIVLIGRVGGPGGLAHLLQSQWAWGSAHTSIWGGANMRETLNTAMRASYWVGVSSLCWIGALLANRRRLPLNIHDLRVLFFTVWFVPPFLFHALVFIHDPDTALDCMTALVAIGAGMLSWSVQGRSVGDVWLVAVAAMSVNVTIFFLSPLHQGRDASYAWVQLVGAETENALDTLAWTPANPHVVVILNRALVTSRQIAYYFPGTIIVDLDRDLSTGCTGSGDNQILLPAGPERVLWIPRFDAHPILPQRFQPGRGLFVADLPAQARFRVGSCEFSD